MDMDGFFSDDNIVIFQRLTFAGITAATRMALFGALNENFTNAQNLAKPREEQKRIAQENDFA